LSIVDADIVRGVKIHGGVRTELYTAVFDFDRVVFLCIIMKALNGFLVIERQMTLKVYYILSKSFIGHLYGDGLLADSVDTTLCIVISCTGDAVYSEVRDQ